MPTSASSPVASLRLVLPLPPGVNNQYATIGKRRVLSAEARAFNRDVAKLVARLRAQGRVPPPVERSLATSLLGAYLVFFFATPHRRDLDGGLKITLDALGRTLGFDDRAIVDLHLTKRIDPLHPRVEVELESIADWEFDRTYYYLGTEAAADEAPPTGRADDRHEPV